MIRKFIAILFLGLTLWGGDCIAQSKEQLFNRDAGKLVKELREMLSRDQQFRGSRAMLDSNVAAVEKTDEANTARMIEIIRIYGFPSTERTERLDEQIAPFILLMHAPEKYYETLKPLLKSELDARRITSFEYQQILWHLNGRIGVPAN